MKASSSLRALQPGRMHGALLKLIGKATCTPQLRVAASGSSPRLRDSDRGANEACSLHGRNPLKVDSSADGRLQGARADAPRGGARLITHRTSRSAGRRTRGASNFLSSGIQKTCWQQKNAGKNVTSLILTLRERRRPDQASGEWKEEESSTAVKDWSVQPRAAERPDSRSESAKTRRGKRAAGTDA